MKRLVTGLLLAAALTGTAAGAQPQRVLAVEWEAGGGKLRWVSPTTLQPVGPAVLNLGGAPADIEAVSPDGKVAAVGDGTDGRIRFVELDGLRRRGLIRLGGPVLGAMWETPNRLVALLGHAPLQVVIVDPGKGTILHRQNLAGVATQAVQADSRLLALVSPRGRIGPARLAMVGADGAARTVSLPGIVAGSARPSKPDGVGRFASPALAAEGSRAVVLGRERLVEINLESLQVRTRTVQMRTTAKLAHGWSRSAVWLEGRTVAFTGYSSTAEEPYDSIGAWLLNVGSGRVRLLDERAAAVGRAGDTLLVHGYDELRGYRLDGTRRFTLLEGTDTGYVQVAGRWAYVGSANSTRFTIVDVEQGRVASRVQTPNSTVVLAP